MLSRISRPVKPVPSSVTPGSSVSLAKAMTYRRSSAWTEESRAATIAHATVAVRSLLIPLRLADAFDADEVARESDGLRHGHAEEERGALRPVGLGRHEVRAHVLEDVDPVVGDEDVVDDERFLRILARDHFDDPRVRADRDDL